MRDRTAEREGRERRETRERIEDMNMIFLEPFAFFGFPFANFAIGCPLSTL
jgi:hypothetical protein